MNRQNIVANFLVFAKIFAKNVCLRSQQLRWHRVSLVNDCAGHDMDTDEYADTQEIILL